MQTEYENRGKVPRKKGRPPKKAAPSFVRARVTGPCRGYGYVIGQTYEMPKADFDKLKKLDAVEKV